MNLKVLGAILPLGCAILSTMAKTVRVVGTTPSPLGELRLNNLLEDAYVIFQKDVDFITKHAKFW